MVGYTHGFDVVDTDNCRGTLVLRQSPYGIEHRPGIVVRKRRGHDHFVSIRGKCFVQCLQIPLKTLLHGVDILPTRYKGYSLVPLTDEMPCCFVHRLAIFGSDKIGLNAGHQPIEQDERDLAGDFLDQFAVATVGLRIEHHAAEAVVEGVAEMLRLPFGIFAIRSEVLPYVKKHSMVSRAAQCFVHSPEHTLLSGSREIDRASVPHN